MMTLNGQASLGMKVGPLFVPTFDTTPVSQPLPPTDYQSGPDCDGPFGPYKQVRGINTKNRLISRY